MRDWEARARRVADGAQSNWYDALAGAFSAQGAARDRLERVARDGGVVVTTGQQPGLFGGPVYTWSKAVSALALADALEEATGVPTAPVFWGATDDADFAEASSTWVALPGGARELRMPSRALEGIPMSDTPLGDLGAELAMLADAAGSAVDPSIIEIARRAYRSDTTVGSAYLELLRALLHPLGVAVIDASHPVLLLRERPLLMDAITRAPRLASALAERSASIRQAGYAPQVADVEGLSLVFARSVNGDGFGEKTRLRIVNDGSPAVPDDARLSPNVLLRPVVERAVLPTVAYVAGPGELTYFAQVSAVAESLGVESPLAVPRWSCTIVEPHVDALLSRLGVTIEELSTPHLVEGRLARARIAPDLLGDLGKMREQIRESAQALRARLQESQLVDPRVVDGVERQMTWRADHLERRLIAAAKRREVATMRDVATLRGALYPGGTRQERALNFLPLLARNGRTLLDAMRRAAREHALSLLGRSSISRSNA